MLSSPGEITRILSKARHLEDLSSLMPLIYAELHRIARHHFRLEQGGHTLQPTALVHEAFLRLMKPSKRRCYYPNRAYFFAAASLAMRRVLVEHARRKRSKKRGGDWQRVDLESVQASGQEDMTDFLALDEALRRLEALDPQLARIVELRFFGHLTVAETAAVLGMGESTIRAHWALAKTWLHREIQG